MYMCKGGVFRLSFPHIILPALWTVDSNAGSMEVDTLTSRILPWSWKNGLVVATLVIMTEMEVKRKQSTMA